MMRAIPSNAVPTALPNTRAVHEPEVSFQPELLTGTGTATLTLPLPAGHAGAPGTLALRYRSDAGNSAFGFGWQLDLPEVRRKTTPQPPCYDDDQDVFLLAGAADLVPVRGENLLGGPAGTTLLGTVVQYRPRAESAFARIEHYHYHNAGPDYWLVRGKDGLVSTYGEAALAVADPANTAVLTDPAAPTRVLAWHLTHTVDAAGHECHYRYHRDQASEGPRRHAQTYLTQLHYAGPAEASPRQLSVELEYGTRPDPFSTYEAGFELRTTRRCVRVCTYSQAAATSQRELLGTYALSYLDERGPAAEQPLNGLSLLRQVQLTTHGAPTAAPPLQFAYTAFRPAGQRCFSVAGPALPAADEVRLLDVSSCGLPDLVQLGNGGRYWKNLGNGRFDHPRPLPTGTALAASAGASGYGPCRAGHGLGSAGQPWVPHSAADADLRAATAESRPEQAAATAQNLSAPAAHIRRGQFAAGRPAVAMIHADRIEYWPDLGQGRWGPGVVMRNSPRLPPNYQPARLLLGDVDGDGLDDLLYLDEQGATLWLNCGGDAWSAPVRLTALPAADAVCLTDLLGTGLAGLLWLSGAPAAGRPHVFLDLAGQTKPYLLHRIEHLPATLTRIRYTASTTFYQQDRQQASTRWRTPQAVPVHVVHQVETQHPALRSRTTTEYSYRHGYWDAQDRAFRGFGRVDQRTRLGQQLSASVDPSGAAEAVPPVAETRWWFHLGPMPGAYEGPQELDLRHEYWAGDAPLLERPAGTQALLQALPAHHRHAAYRALCGTTLRMELYHGPRQHRPRTVVEYLTGVAHVIPRQVDADTTGCWLSSDGQLPPLAQLLPPLHPELVFFAHPLAQRFTQWAPDGTSCTQLSLWAGYDNYGQPRQQLLLTLPGGWSRAAPVAGARVVYALTDYQGYDADPISPTHGHNRYDSPSQYLVSRVARNRVYRIPPGPISLSPWAFAQAVLSGQVTGQLINECEADAPASAVLRPC